MEVSALPTDKVYEKRLGDGSPVTLRLGAYKQLRITVTGPGEVRITAPSRVGVRAALAFANEHLGWIERHRAEVIAHAGAAPQFTAGERVRLWGETYPLRVAAGKPGAVFDGECVTITVPEGSDAAERRAALGQLYRRELTEAIPPLIAKYAALLDVEPPAWSLRDMRTRYGSCTAARKTVRFSLILAEKPHECLEYVVAHELTHLRIHGHGADFHALVRSVYPDEQRARALLRQS